MIRKKNNVYSTLLTALLLSERSDFPSQAAEKPQKDTNNNRRRATSRDALGQSVFLCFPDCWPCAQMLQLNIVDLTAWTV